MSEPNNPPCPECSGDDVVFEGITIRCDLCGKEQYYEGNAMNAAVNKATKEGWLATRERDRCPSCVEAHGK